MIISLLLVLFVTGSGTIATYLYDEGASLAARLCSGACVGLVALGLVSFVFASFLGLTPLAICLTVLVLTLPLLTLKNQRRRKALLLDLANASQSIKHTLHNPRGPALGYAIFYGIVIVIMWWVFSRAMIELPDGIYTGLLNNFGDLPFHLSVITSFAYGNNFQPEDPTYAGVKFTYPFLSDFISAIFVRCGASLRESMFIENFVLGVSFVGLLHRWALELVRNRLAAVLTPLLVILNGGFGWILLWEKARENKQNSVGFLASLPPSFTIIPDTVWRWGNAISTLLIPQRGFLLGLPLAVIVFTQWWMSAGQKQDGVNGQTGKEHEKEKHRKPSKKESRKKENKITVPAFPSLGVSSLHRMIAAGVVAGLLPLVHAHSFVVIMVVGACISLLQRRWRDWVIFFVVASVIALPQMWWSTHDSSVKASTFFEWQFGWDSAKENFFAPLLAGSQFLETMPRLREAVTRFPNVGMFWLKNTGFFIPLILLAILWRGKKQLISGRLLQYYLPFTICFIVPNLIKMAPWVWDNIKILFYWWLASAPLVAILLVRLWNEGKLRRVAALVLFVGLTLAGSLDVASIVLRSQKYQIFDNAGLQFAEIVKRETEPRALIIHAPVHNHPVFLTGRRSLMGYPGHIWTHGLDFVEREGEIKRFFAGAPDAIQIVQKYQASYAVVGPLERGVANVNDQFFSHFTKIGESGEYRLYKIAPP